MREAVDTKQLRSFGCLVGGIFAIIGILPPVLHGEGIRLWALMLGGLLILLGLVWPRILAPIHRFWMALGHILGFINTRIILSVIFYGMFTPARAILRLAGKELIQRKFDPKADSYRVPRTPRQITHLKHQF
jgi:hypothetical protein